MISNAELAMGGKWWIAGGWAACPQLASDQDVWISAPSSDLKTVVEDLRLTFPSIDADAADSSDAEGYDTLAIEIKRVGKLGNRHIMVTNATDIQTFLDAFDISTHQCALTSEFEFVKGHQWTPITEPPVQLRDTPNTYARMVKIAERYKQFAPAYRQHGFEVVPF